MKDNPVSSTGDDPYTPQENKPQERSENAGDTGSHLNIDRPLQTPYRAVQRHIPRLPGGPGRTRFPEKDIGGIPHKWCDHCRRFKPMGEFRYDKTKGRRMPPCKPCHNLNLRRWRDENRERYNEYMRNYMRGRRNEQSNSSDEVQERD